MYAARYDQAPSCATDYIPERKNRKIFTCSDGAPDASSGGRTRRPPLHESLDQRHPERSRFSGGVKDLPAYVSVAARFLAPLVKTRGFGMTPWENDCLRGVW